MHKQVAVLIETTHGQYFMVDLEDEERVRAKKWSANFINGGWYAVSWDGGKHTLLHRLVMNADKRAIIDHVDGNTLNCCKSNLRVATRQQNNLNRKAKGGREYKGIAKAGRRWQAVIGMNYKVKSLGFFGSAEEAAKAYDAAAVVLHGEFARLNFPDQVPASCDVDLSWLLVPLTEDELAHRRLDDKKKNGHATQAAYKRGCRCKYCKKAHADYARERYVSGSRRGKTQNRVQNQPIAALPSAVESATTC